jgi:serine/threonine protein kinase
VPDRYPLRLGPFVVVTPLVQEAVPEIGLAFSRRGGRVRACLLKQVRLAGRDTEDLEAAFARANRVSRRLSHRQLAGAFAAGRLEGRLFLAEDCAPGRLLAQLPQRPVPVKTAAAIARELAGGLAYLHRFDGAGLAHRRLGPEQVYLRFDGRVQLLDSPFAGSTRAGDPPFARAMRPSPRYLPPEIQNGERGSAQSDLYMLGALLWEMLTGRSYEPTGGEAWRALLPLPAGVPSGLRELLARLLSPAPPDRPAGAAEVERLLNRFVPWIPGGRYLVRRLLASAMDVRAEVKQLARWAEEARALLPRPTPAAAPAAAAGRSARVWLASLLSWPRRLALPALVGAVATTALLVLSRPSPPQPEPPPPPLPMATVAPPDEPPPAPPAEPPPVPAAVEPPAPEAAEPRRSPAPKQTTAGRRPRPLAPSEARARGETLLEGAEVRFQWRDFDGAERMVREALLEIPNSPRPHYLLGLVLLARGEAAAAAEAFARAIEIEPGYQDAARKLKIAQERASIR